MDKDKEDRIRARAHAIWQSEGEPDGAEQRHWDQAERELAEQAEENVGTTDNVQDTELTSDLATIDDPVEADVVQPGGMLSDAEPGPLDQADEDIKPDLGGRVMNPLKR